MGEQAIGAVQGPTTTKVNPVTFSLTSIRTGAAEKMYAKFATVTSADKKTLQAFNNIDFGYGDGYNGLTAMQDPLAYGNGALNTHCKYQPDENGDLVPPTRTMMLMA